MIMIMMMLLPKLQNIVSTANLGCTLNLKRIAMHALNAEYNPNRFSAVVMRIKSPKTTALIFSSGKIVCTEAKTEQDSLLAARKYVKIVQKLGYPDATCAEFKIQNLVASCDAGFVIRLEKLSCSSHSGFISYEPELFPGLIYRMKKPRVTVLVFSSGKVVIAGAKRRHETCAAFKNIFPVL